MGPALWILGESLLGRSRPQQNFAESPQEVDDD